MRDLVANDVELAFLCDALDAQDRTRLAACELAELVPRRSLARRRVAVVHEQQLRPRRAQQPRRVLRGIRRDAVLVHRLLRLLAFEELRQLAHRPPVRDAGRDVRPLARVGALRKQPAELVDRRPRAQDPVRVVVDELDVTQYFEK